MDEFRIYLPLQVALREELHDSIIGWGTELQGERLRVRFPIKTLDFFPQFSQSTQPQYDPGFDSASNRNGYQESSWG
jgi:hypothetical protein